MRIRLNSNEYKSRRFTAWSRGFLKAVISQNFRRAIFVSIPHFTKAGIETKPGDLRDVSHPSHFDLGFFSRAGRAPAQFGKINPGRSPKMVR